MLDTTNICSAMHTESTAYLSKSSGFHPDVAVMQQATPLREISCASNLVFLSHYSLSWEISAILLSTYC